jgi:hypothetical protein
MEKTRRPYYRRSKEYVPTSYKNTDLAYLAGIIDGEGCFFITKVPKKEGDGYVSEHYRGLLKIDNTDYKLIEWLNKVFSGSNSAATRTTSSRQFEREVFSWIATGDRLLDLSELVMPYLVVKKEHCENMIKFRKTYTAKLGCNKLEEKELIIRQECLEKSKKLNSRFHLHPLKQNP